MGESAMTTIPQRDNITKNKVWEGIINNKGEIPQKIPESVSDTNAVFLAPLYKEIYPLMIHAIAPIPITIKEEIAVFKELFGCIAVYVVMIKGTKAQKA